MAVSPRLRWGLLGSGGICNDFAAGVVTSGGHIAAIGASSLSKAQALADKVQPEAKAYGSYEELVIDPNVDVVYVGTIHTLHLPHTKMALLAGKPVICEKPLAVNQREAEEMIDLARSKGLFLMEAMWTRFFPIYRKLREILEGGKDIGIPRCVQADFGFVMDLTDPNHRLLDPALAGGAMLDIGIYLVQLATMIFGNVEPEMKCTAILSNENVDQEGSLSLTWKDKGSASLLFTLRATTPENTVIMGDQGFLRIHGPAHSPTRMTVSKKGKKRLGVNVVSLWRKSSTFHCQSWRLAFLWIIQHPKGCSIKFWLLRNVFKKVNWNVQCLSCSFLNVKFVTKQTQKKQPEHLINHKWQLRCLQHV